MKRAVIFAGGNVSDLTKLPFKISGDDYIICADCGVKHCIRFGINVDLWVGDFDSADFDEYCQKDVLKNAEIIRLNAKKDDTDTEYALDCAVSKGFKEIILLGAIGNRFDHSFANVFLLEKAYDSLVNLTLITEDNVIRLLKRGEMTVSKSNFKYVSIIPLEQSIVSCEGFLYPLSAEVLYRNSTRGISNELITECGIVEVHRGCVLIVESKD